METSRHPRFEAKGPVPQEEGFVEKTFKNLSPNWTRKIDEMREKAVGKKGELKSEDSREEKEAA